MCSKESDYIYAENEGECSESLVLELAIDKKIISKKERALIEEAGKARRLAIMVDDFVAAETK